MSALCDSPCISRVAIAAVLALSGAVAAPCQEPPSCQDPELRKAIANCAAYDDTADRLSCFDALAHTVAPAAAKAPAQPASAEPSTGRWELVSMKNPLDDTTTVSIGSWSEQLQAQMVLRCRERKLDVLLSWRGRFIGATEPVIWTRLGTAKADKRRWMASADHKAAFLAPPQKPFVQQLLSVDRLVVQTDHFAQGRMVDVFDLRGLKESIGPLKQECSIE